MSKGYREDFSNAGDLFRYVRTLDPTRYKWSADLIGSGVVVKASDTRRMHLSDCVVPDIYQDPIYMEAVMKHFEPKATEEQLACDLAIRKASKMFFGDDKAWNYLTEDAISRPFDGSYKTISYLARLAQPGIITVQIVPDAAVAKDLDGLGAIAGGALTYFGFGHVYFEDKGVPQTNMSEEQAARLFRAAARHAYPPDESVWMLGAAAALHQAEGR